MATSQVSAPSLGRNELSEKQESLSDTKSGLDEEKQPFERKDHVEIDDIGDVFAEGPRLIDLGEDGKEKPISKHIFSWIIVRSLTTIPISQPPTRTTHFV